VALTWTPRQCRDEIGGHILASTVLAWRIVEPVLLRFEVRKNLGVASVEKAKHIPGRPCGVRARYHLPPAAG
jgi:hypothetical protein